MAAYSGGRDLRLDFFRGLALWFIFIDHTPANWFAWATPRNYGISDATEVFVFISGYTASLVYTRLLDSHGWGYAAAKVLHRVWTLYITYIFLFFAFTAQLAYTARVFDNPLFTEELGLTAYFADPVQALIQALALKFRPVNLDILPLYIILLGLFPLTLPLVKRHPLVVVTASLALYLAARRWGWNLPTYPSGGVWLFNPFCWQFLFVLGAALRQMPGVGAALVSRCRWAVAIAIAILAASFVLALSWQFANLATLIPASVTDRLYPIDKTSLDPLRLLHFFALAYLVLQFTPAEAPWLRSRWAAPLVACGRESLHVFAFGVFLSFTAEIVLLHVDGSLFAQFSVTVLGIIAMVALARLLIWYRRAGRRASLESS